jgi:predicted nucleotidyltransferase
MNSDVLRAQLAAALERHAEVELALLFGSRARGAATSTSDVDIAVIGPGIDTIGRAVELTDAVGLVVEVVDLSKDPSFALLLEVLRDGVKVHEGRPGAYGRFLSHSLMDLETDLPALRKMHHAFVRRVAERGLTGAS